MPSKATKARRLADIRRRIDQHGWAVQAIGDQCSVPGCCGSRGGPEDADFGYTVGLTRYHDHPELIVTGVPQMETARPLNIIGERVRTGERFAAGELVAGVQACRCRVALVEVDPRQSARHLVYANMMYRYPGAPPVRALQVVWPDQRGRFPWQPGYAFAAWVQPVLGPVPEGV